MKWQDFHENAFNGQKCCGSLNLSSVDSQLELWSDAYGWTNFQLLLKLVLVLSQNYRTQFLQRDQTLSVPFATEGKAGETSSAPKVSEDKNSSLGALPQAVMM